MPVNFNLEPTQIIVFIVIFIANHFVMKRQTEKHEAAIQGFVVQMGTISEHAARLAAVVEGLEKRIELLERRAESRGHGAHA